MSARPLPATNAAPNYFAALSLTDARRRLVWSPAVPHQRSITHDVLLSCTTPWTVGHAQKSRCVRASDSISASPILTKMRERSKSRRDERQLYSIVTRTLHSLDRCPSSTLSPTFTVAANPAIAIHVPLRNGLLLLIFFLSSIALLLQLFYVVCFFVSLEVEVTE